MKTNRFRPHRKYNLTHDMAGKYEIYFIFSSGMSSGTQTFCFLLTPTVCEGEKKLFSDGVCSVGGRRWCVTSNKNPPSIILWANVVKKRASGSNSSLDAFTEQ